LEVFAIFTAFGLAASAGLNAYIPLLVLSLLAKFTPLIQLSTPWQNVMESWWVIGLLILLTIVEFFADKFPVVNHINDIVMTFIRPIAGAIVFAAVTSHSIVKVNPIFAAILGILMAGSVHAVKAGVVRPVVTAATGTAGNIPVSMAEDGICTVMSVTAIIMPILVVVLMIGLILLTVFIVKKMIRKRKQKAEEAKLKKMKRNLDEDESVDKVEVENDQGK
jgi:uncharacterized membrane protein